MLHRFILRSWCYIGRRAAFAGRRSISFFGIAGLLVAPAAAMQPVEGIAAAARPSANIFQTTAGITPVEIFLRQLFYEAAWFILHERSETVTFVGIRDPELMFGPGDHHVKQP